MKKLLGMFAVTLLVCAVPDSASGQCGAVCTRFVKETGEIGGHGCISALNDDSCVATVTRCTVSRCVNALLTTPEGRVVGQLACSGSEAEAPGFASPALAIPARLFTAFARQVEVAMDTGLRSPTEST